MTNKEVENLLNNHRNNVAGLLQIIREELNTRDIEHDQDKFDPEQFNLHKEFVPKLSQCEYGSKEYKNCLSGLTPALKKHYANSRHHPEHFTNGIRGMNLIDLLEMLCDWLSSTRRQKNGDIFRSIDINQSRFGYGDDLAQILENTAAYLLEKEKEDVD